MSLLAFLLLAAAPPDIPVGEVQIIVESGQYVLRTLPGGMPLYTYDRDTPGKSNCTGQCIAAWPALAAPAAAKPIGKWTVIARPDGSKQWAYDSKPVYTFARDLEGTPSGDGMGGTWHLLPTTPR